MPNTLIIGFGNMDRADDGVAFAVVNALRYRLGQQALPEDETGLDALGSPVDSVFLLQLTPDLMDEMGRYERIVFVDAHVDENMDDLHCGPVLPEQATLTFTHHMSPEMLLALLKVLHAREPAGYLVSIRGHDFDFHRRLSPETASQVEPAVERILRLAEDD
jgi:hydrogenase maturation protease